MLLLLYGGVMLLDETVRTLRVLAGF